MSDRRPFMPRWAAVWPRLAWRIAALRRIAMAEAAALAVQAVARIPALRLLPRMALRPVERTLIRLRGPELFDRDFYLARNADVRAAGSDAFVHYLRYGWREGRPVNPQFDDGHYRAISGLVRGAPVSALAHYIAFGRKLGLCPVPGISLDAHGIAAPEIAVARMDPYRHLLGGPERTPLLPDADAIARRCEDLSPPPGKARAAVIMPAYLGHAETLNAICHVIEARGQTPFRLIVVNDASPETGLAEDLSRLAARGIIELATFERNRGFVHAINHGCRMAGDLDTIWLNSDTEVHDGWIDRLRRAAYSEDRIATVTPLTNNGTICSYPRTNTDNPGPLETGWAALDRMAAAANPGQTVESPTAVGFATYVRRAALETVGPLDEQAFGRGYGEENDFSQRALRAGWKNLIAADVFVHHLGAMSFRGTRADRIEAALKVLDRRYPGYNASVAAHLASDPLRPARAALDRARLMALRRGRNVLVVSHASGGGTQQHVMEETRRLLDAGVSVFTLTGGFGGPATARLAHATGAAMPELERLPLDEDDLWNLLASLRLSAVHLHHLIDFGAEGPAVFRRRLRELGVPHDVIVHDYFAACPRVTLTDLQGQYCGEPGEAACRRCIERRGSRVGRPEIVAWRRAHGEILAEAREIRVPDPDVAARLKRYFHGLDQIRVCPHEPPGSLAPREPGRRRPGPCRIAVIGAIGPTKGFDILLATARHFAAAGPEVAFTVIGYTRDDPTAEAAGIKVTGAYVNADVDAMIDDLDPDLVWIPSIWPETYSYTLSIALRSGRPVAAFEIGALGTRLRGVARATRLAIELSREPEKLAPRLLEAARPAIVCQPELS